MKPFHVKQIKILVLFGPEVDKLWIASHKWSASEAMGRTPSDAVENLRNMLKARRHRSEAGEMMLGYTARRLQWVKENASWLPRQMCS